MNNSTFYLYFLYNSSKYNFLCSLCPTLSTFKLPNKHFQNFLAHHCNYNQGQSTFEKKICLDITDPYEKTFTKTLPHLPVINFDVCLMKLSNNSSATPVINIDFWKRGWVKKATDSWLSEIQKLLWKGVIEEIDIFF